MESQKCCWNHPPIDQWKQMAQESRVWKGSRMVKWRVYICQLKDSKGALRKHIITVSYIIYTYISIDYRCIYLVMVHELSDTLRICQKNRSQQCTSRKVKALLFFWVLWPQNDQIKNVTPNVKHSHINAPRWTVDLSQRGMFLVPSYSKMTILPESDATTWRSKVQMEATCFLWSGL